MEDGLRDIGGQVGERENLSDIALAAVFMPSQILDGGERAAEKFSPESVGLGYIPNQYGARSRFIRYGFAIGSHDNFLPAARS